MEFLKIIKRRSFLNEVMYVVLNVLLAVTLMVIVKTTNSMWPAFTLVLLSKWRIFAVRTRFWFANIQANMVSIIVSLSFVVFLYTTNIANIGELQKIAIQIALVIIDIAWLLFLKSKSKRRYIITQAGVGLFVGITAIFSLSYSWIASPVVLLSWLVGYSTARHVLGSYDKEDHTMLLSIIWGLGVAEVSWLAYHWTIAYRLPILSNMLLPQVSIIVFCLGLLAYKTYDLHNNHQKARLNDIILPLIFTTSIIAVLLLFFNNVETII